MAENYEGTVKAIPWSQPEVIEVVHCTSFLNAENKEPSIIWRSLENMYNWPNMLFREEERTNPEDCLEEKD